MLQHSLLSTEEIDRISGAIAVLGIATPSFWLGMIIILGLLTMFSWIPPLTFTPFMQDPKANLLQLIWPAMAVGYRYSAVSTRMMRSRNRTSRSPI